MGGDASNKKAKVALKKRRIRKRKLKSKQRRKTIEGKRRKAAERV